MICLLGMYPPQSESQPLVGSIIWSYRKYAPGNAVLEALEKDAREAR
jgi:hypothetical protein